MSITRSLGGTVEIDGSKFDWQLVSEPKLSSDHGWRGMTISLRQENMQREAVLEFPTPQRLIQGLPKGRTQISEAIVERGVKAALLAGWDPASRGKTMRFMVDANGD